MILPTSSPARPRARRPGSTGGRARPCSRKSRQAPSCRLTCDSPQIPPASARPPRLGAPERAASNMSSARSGAAADCSRTRPGRHHHEAELALVPWPSGAPRRRPRVPRPSPPHLPRAPASSASCSARVHPAPSRPGSCPRAGAPAGETGIEEFADLVAGIAITEEGDPPSAMPSRPSTSSKVRRRIEPIRPCPPDSPRRARCGSARETACAADGGYASSVLLSTSSPQPYKACCGRSRVSTRPGLGGARAAAGTLALQDHRLAAVADLLVPPDRGRPRGGAAPVRTIGAASQQRADAGFELVDVEGLDQIVVRPRVQSAMRSLVASRAVSTSTGTGLAAARRRCSTCRPSMRGRPRSSTAAQVLVGERMQRARAVLHQSTV